MNGKKERKKERKKESIVKFYGDDAEEEFFCIPSKGSGTYLTRTLIEEC